MSNSKELLKAKELLKRDAEKARKIIIEEALLRKYDQKPVIETIINTSALALTSYGVINIKTGGYVGYISLSFGMLLEFIKYYGRKKNMW